VGDFVARKALSKKIRFEVFKRDSFKCQYCGQSAPDVVLHIDHIIPVAENGSNDLLNLITSCFECNSGKGARVLSDTTVIKKQISQMQAVEEKREQLKMLAQWKQSMKDIADDELEAFEQFLDKNYDVLLSEYGQKSFRQTIRRFGFSEVIDATQKSADQYLHDVSVKEQRVKFLDYIPKICYWTKREKENPVEAELRKIAFTARKIWYTCNPQSLSRRLIELNSQYQIQPDELFRMVMSSSGIMQFEDQVVEWIEGD
jgi:hypothetical protein